MRVWVTLFLLSLGLSTANAHPLQFGVLQLREHPGGRVDLSFQFSGSESRPYSVKPLLSDPCKSLDSEVETTQGFGASQYTRLECGSSGLEGVTLSMEGLKGQVSQIVVRIHRADNSETRTLLDGATTDFKIPPQKAPTNALLRYLTLGIEHILSGPDHLLFVAALVLLIPSRRLLVVTITAFTFGHSITLGLAVLGIFRFPALPIEAVIALSVLLLAVELARRETQLSTLTMRFPWAVSAVFGLLHGFGFAGALSQIGLPRDAVAPALLGFNAGVEVGQLLFVAVVLILRVVVSHIPKPSWSGRLIPYTIGSVAAFWCIERIIRLG